MGGSVRKLLLGLTLPFVALCACQTSKDEMDIGTNPILYTSPGYHVRMPADRAAFMPPVADKRTGSGPEDASGPYPVKWMAESYWQRPIVVMFDEVLRNELEEAGVFASIEASPPPSPEAVIVQVDIITARCGLEENPSKRRTMAELDVLVTVRGPVDAGGDRDVIWQEQFQEVSASEASTRPPTVPAMFGSVAKRVVSRVCSKLDESNVGRSGIPISTSDG